MSTTKRKVGGLGQGLGALLQNNGVNFSEKQALNGISFILVSQIEANPFQPRTHFEQERLQELSNSIAVHGLVQPVTVRKLANNKYQLISGERRTRASILAGLETIPAYVRMANDQEMLELALIENIQRTDLNAIEIALSYKRLLTECNLKQEELGDRVGKNRTTVNNYLRLLKLPEQIQIGIQEGKLSMGHARAIINMDDMVQQIEYYDQIVTKNLSVREVESMVKGAKLNSQSEKMGVVGTDWDPEIDAIITKFITLLGAPVHVKSTAKGSGKLVISYKNQEQLEQILAKIN